MRGSFELPRRPLLLTLFQEVTSAVRSQNLVRVIRRASRHKKGVVWGEPPLHHVLNRGRESCHDGWAMWTGVQRSGARRYPCEMLGSTQVPRGVPRLGEKLRKRFEIGPGLQTAQHAGAPSGRADCTGIDFFPSAFVWTGTTMTDYKKWDKFAAEDDDEEAAPPAYSTAQRAAAEAEAAARAARAPPPPRDDRSEIEKLKAARRLARETAAASAPAAGGGAAIASPPEPAPQAAATTAVAADPVSRLVAAEAALASLRAESDAVRAGLSSSASADEVQALLGRVVAAQGGVGALQAAVDEIAVGELEDEAVRDDARARRKLLNRAVEDELIPKWTALRADALAAKKRFGA